MFEFKPKLLFKVTVKSTVSPILNLVFEGSNFKLVASQKKFQTPPVSP